MGIERGFMEEAAPEPGHGDKERGGRAHQASGKHKQKRRVGQAQEALSYLHWLGAGQQWGWDRGCGGGRCGP